jgi:hypothetical protein
MSTRLRLADAFAAQKSRQNLGIERWAAQSDAARPSRRQPAEIDALARSPRDHRN